MSRDGVDDVGDRGAGRGCVVVAIREVRVRFCTEYDYEPTGPFAVQVVNSRRASLEHGATFGDLDAAVRDFAYWALPVMGNRMATVLDARETIVLHYLCDDIDGMDVKWWACRAGMEALAASGIDRLRAELYEQVALSMMGLA